MENFDFDEVEHERRIAERYRQLARYQAFDQLIDMALDGIITMPEAIQAFIEDEKEAIHSLE